MEQLYSYYPTYSVLDELVSYNSPKMVNVFLDLKNNMQGLFVKDIVVNLINESLQTPNKIDTSIFKSVVSFIAFHKEYFTKRNISSNFYIFYDSGQSYYHINIDKRYKSNRNISELLGLDLTQTEYYEFLRKRNFMLIESVLNKTPGIHVIHFEHMETDFIPYYLIRNNLVERNESTINVVYSNDHDLLQCLNLGEDVFVYAKSKSGRRILKSGDAFNSYFGTSEVSDKYLTLGMSIMGDAGDYVIGIHGIGKKRIIPVLKSVSEHVDIDVIRDKISNNKKLFDMPLNNDKYLNMIKDAEDTTGIVSKNMKLVDFELISRFLDESITMKDRRECIDKVLHRRAVAKIEDLTEALRRTGTIFNGELELCYKG